MTNNGRDTFTIDIDIDTQKEYFMIGYQSDDTSDLPKLQVSPSELPLMNTRLKPFSVKIRKIVYERYPYKRKATGTVIFYSTTVESWVWSMSTEDFFTLAYTSKGECLSLIKSIQDAFKPKGSSGENDDDFVEILGFEDIYFGSYTLHDVSNGGIRSGTTNIIIVDSNSSDDIKDALGARHKGFAYLITPQEVPPRVLSHLNYESLPGGESPRIYTIRYSRTGNMNDLVILYAVLSKADIIKLSEMGYHYYYQKCRF